MAQGTPPTVYNAIAVFPRDAGQVPPLWKPFQVMTGTLEVTTDSSQWKKDGIVQLRDAQIGVPGVTRPIRMFMSGPFIPLDEKLIVLAIFLLLTLRWRKKESSSISKDASHV